MKSIILLLLILSQFIQAESNTPYYDVLGDIRVDTGDVSQASIRKWNPRTQTVVAPPGPAATLTGFDTGFAIIASVNEQGIILDKVDITKFAWSLYHLNVTTGAETPVIGKDGKPMVDIDVKQLNDEGTAVRPTLFSTKSNGGLFRDLGNPAVGIDDETPTIGTTLYKVDAIFSTKHKFAWGSSPDFTQPTVGSGYVLHWNIRFIPTYLGVKYPEVTLANEGNLDIQFTYKVVDILLPELVKLSNDGPNGGTILQMSGEYLEFFKLQRSTDLETWTDWTRTGEGDFWTNNYVIPKDDGFYSDTFQWELFDRAYPNERRQAPKEFYRMTWTGKRFTWRSWSPVKSS